MNYRKILVCLALLISLPVFSYSKHIIGGVLYYEYMSSPGNNVNRYRFVLKMYRDCIPGPNKADFDGVDATTPRALFSVFRGQTLVNGGLDFGSPNIRQIDGASNNPCIEVPPNVCVEEGTYEVIVDLPVSNESYHVVYQRCCRNESISNIIRPGDTGSSFYVEITPVAQQLRNSSPQFRNFPPIIICSNFPIDFDHGATDVDGDFLEYSFCAPFVGGGNNTMGNGGCEDVSPNPECPPPYDEVVFRAPYSAINPIGGSPPLAINPTSGLLTGTPGTLGQFTVGIRVREYRNNVLISEIRRDFQFNVTDCIKSIDATLLIQSEKLNVKGKDLTIRLCGEKELMMTLANPSGDKILSYDWEVSDVTSQLIAQSNENSLDVTFPDFATYHGKVILNRGLPCADSSLVTFLVFPEINADFTFDYDTCYGQEIDFTNESVSGAGPITQSEWYAGDALFAQSFDATFNTLAPDYYEMKLIVEDQNGCLDSLTQEVPFFPIPKDELLRPADVTGCEPYSHLFKPVETYLTEDYIFVWDFGDGETGSGLNPTHIYTEPGVYNISLSVTNHFGCQISASFDGLITILQSPDAGFSYLPRELSNLKPTITIRDESQFATYWLYAFSNGYNTNESNPVYTFPDTGYYNLTQYVTHENGCRDSLTLLIDVAPKYTIYLPNAFVPSNAGENSVFGPKGIPYGVKSYEMSIFDRWGNVVYKSNDFNEKWDGKGGDGRIMMNGTYPVKVSIIGPRGEANEIYGTAVLIQ